MTTLSGQLLLGRPVQLKPCVRKRSNDDASRKQSSALYSQRWQRTQRDAPLLSPMHEQRRVIISGLPKRVSQHTSDLQVRALFEGFNVEAVSKVKSPTDSSGGGVYYAFIDFATAQEAKCAVQEMDGVEVWGAKVRVGKAVGVPEKVFEREIWESEEDVLKTMRDMRTERGLELEQHPA
jgi:hypothetical protein